MSAAAWQRRGRLIAAPLELPWARSHAALPTVVPSADGAPDRWDLYVSARDDRNRAHVVRATLSALGGRLAIEDVSPEPVLAPGELGAFDDSGVTVSCAVDHDGTRFLYYSGWSLGVTVPFYFYVGLAVSDDGGRTFRRVSRAPILERTVEDPFLTASPAVLVENGAWRMWYVSASGWEALDGTPRHRYRIRSAQSTDGVRWERDAGVAVDFADPSEHAFGRPCVLRDGGGGYHMWFCARGDRYRLAHARSADGRAWERDDAGASLTGPPEPWDADSQSYPWVFDDGSGTRHMLYNGNGYGATGVGWAASTTGTT